MNKLVANFVCVLFCNVHSFCDSFFDEIAHTLQLEMQLERKDIWLYEENYGL